MDAKITSQHQWVNKLEKLVPEIVPLQLHRKQDAMYSIEKDGKRFYPDVDAFNLSNHADHDALIQRAVRALLKRSEARVVGHLIDELTFRKTYGAFSELAAYDWLETADIDYTPQVPLSSVDVVNPNGSTVDGKMEIAGQTAFFDVKGFGFIDHKLELLRKRLEEQFPDEGVAIEGMTSVSLDEVQMLMERNGFALLSAELNKSKRADRGTLRFSRQKGTIRTSVTEPDPKKLALSNRSYALRFGSQFTRHAPFILFFVIHPWFSQGNLHQNFDSFTDRFARAFGELTFNSFDEDATPLEGIPTNQLLRLLSAIAFINVWPQPSSAGAGPTARFLLNPNALNPLSAEAFATLTTKLGDAVTVTLIESPRTTP